MIKEMKQNTSHQFNSICIPNCIKVTNLFICPCTLHYITYLKKLVRDSVYYFKQDEKNNSQIDGRNMYTTYRKHYRFVSAIQMVSRGTYMAHGMFTYIQSDQK